MQTVTLYVLFVLAVVSPTIAQPWVPAPNPQQDWMTWIWMDRFQANVEYSRLNGANINVLFYGDSITEGWDWAARSIWDMAYAPLGAANYGIGGDGTQNVLWRIINGEVDNISPRLIVLKIGTNNMGWNAEADIARGVTAIVDELRSRLPNTKILLLGILPRINSEETAAAERINAIFASNDNGNTVRYLNMIDAFYGGNGQFFWELYSSDLLHLAFPGNVFVIAAILLERNLQSVANYLILSLAVADLLVACLVMPLSAVYEVSQEWKLGPELCDMWTSSDVLCCTSSILHLVAIAIDRYWAVTNIDYVHHRTAGRIGIMILVVWALSLFVSVAPLLGWKDPKWYERVNVQYECMVSQDISYQVFATASSFYVPLFVILVLYWRIFQTARKRIRRRQQGKSIVQLMPKAFATQTYPEPLMANTSCMALTTIGFRWKVSSSQAAQQGLIASAAGGSGGIAACVVTVIGRPLPTISETTTAFTNVSSANTSPEKGSFGNGVERIEADPITTDNASIPYPAPVIKSTIRKKAQNSADSKRERKAAKTLAIITGAFVFCWLPFFISAILLPACPTIAISPVLMSLFLWLGYFNSTLNPIIYTIFSPEFRHAFKRILCGRKNNIRRRTGLRR